ncbi:MAG: LPS assembly protein LptD, partial [Opitutales bacterium]|nr:LPS assembly protein LptD [Opitutales bacterium]
FTPVAGARLTHYANTLKGGNYWRALGQVGFDAQMQAWGLWQLRSKTLGIDGLRHSLRPILQYRYIPNAEDGASRIKAIDELYLDNQPAVLDLGLMRNVDELYKTNTLRVGLENVFETRGGRYGSREVARLNFYQDFNFERRPYISDKSKEYSYSDFYFFGSVSPAEWLNVGNYTRVNANNADLAETNTYLELHDGDAWRVVFGDVYLQGDINQYYVHAELRLTENYRLRGRWHYDYKNSRMTSQVYSLWTRVGNSWAVEYRISVKEGSKRENNLSFGANVRFLSY